MSSPPERTVYELQRDIFREAGIDKTELDDRNAIFKSKITEQLKKKFELMAIPKETLNELLTGLLSMLYLIDYEEKESRSTFKWVVWCFNYYSMSKIVPIYSSFDNRGEIERNLLIRFLNKKQNICISGQKKNKQLNLEINSLSYEPKKSFMRSSPKDFLSIIKDCEHEDFTVISLVIYFYLKADKDSDQSSSHANSLIVKGKKVYRIEPNIYPQGNQLLDFFFTQINTDLIVNQYKRGFDEDSINKQLYDQYELDHFKTGKYTLIINGDEHYFEDDINLALSTYFDNPLLKDQGYTFEGFYPEDNYFCTGEHGGLCNTINVIQIFKKDISLFDLKYYIISFCRYLYKKIFGTEFVIKTDTEVFVDVFNVISSSGFNIIHSNYYVAYENDRVKYAKEGDNITDFTSLTPIDFIGIRFKKDAYTSISGYMNQFYEIFNFKPYTGSLDLSRRTLKEFEDQRKERDSTETLFQFGSKNNLKSQIKMVNYDILYLKN